jgi:uncharacterized phage protein gp47/JayE
MTFVAQPYEPFVDDLLTGLTGGVIREEHRFIGSEEPYVLSSPGAMAASVKVFGQREELFRVFIRGVDYHYEVETEAIVWKQGGIVPDDHSYFYVNYDRQEADRKLTDRNPGSVTSILAETFAREFAVLTKQMEFIYKSGFVDLATGTSLDHVAALLGLERKGANFASGEVLFKRGSPAPADITIPAGTAVTTNEGQMFETADKRTLRRAQLSIATPIRAQVEGQVGMVPAGAIQIINRPIFGIDAVVNERNTVLATEIESDDAFRRRIKATLERAGRATLGAIRTALIESVPGVNEGNVQISEDPQAPGKVHVKFALGGTVEQALVRTVEETIFYARPAGIRVTHNLPTGTAAEAAQGIGPDGLPIHRQDVLARLAKLGGAIQTTAVPEQLLSMMPEGILNLQVEVLVRLTELNLSVEEKEQIAGEIRSGVVNYMTGLPMGADVVYHKLLGRVTESEQVTDATMSVRAVVPGSATSTDVYKTNLSSSGRKALVSPEAVFIGLMGERILVDVVILVEAKSGVANGQVATIPSVVETVVRTNLISLFGEMDSALKMVQVSAIIRQAVEGSSQALQLVEDRPVSISAFYEDSGRVLNNADTVPIESHQVFELRNLSLSVKGQLDG